MHCGHGHGNEDGTHEHGHEGYEHGHDNHEDSCAEYVEDTEKNQYCKEFPMNSFMYGTMLGFASSVLV